MKSNQPDSLKRSLWEHLYGLITARISEAETAIAATRESRDSDTKSTAGDKHEVGRAMIQIELDNQSAQLEKNRTLLRELERIPQERVYDAVAFGSMIHTSNGVYFISIGLGQVKLDDSLYYVISPASPIATPMLGLVVGEHFTFNGNRIEILDIN